MQGFTAVFGLFMVPQRTERAAPLAYADAAAVAAAYAAARAARTPPPPPAGTLSEAQLRQLPAKEARRAPAAALPELPAPPAAPAAPARSPPQPWGDKRWAQTPPSLGSCARRWRASTWSSCPAWTRTRSFARSPRRRRASYGSECTTAHVHTHTQQWVLPSGSGMCMRARASASVRVQWCVCVCAVCSVYVSEVWLSRQCGCDLRALCVRSLYSVCARACKALCLWVRVVCRLFGDFFLERGVFIYITVSLLLLAFSFTLQPFSAYARCTRVRYRASATAETARHPAPRAILRVCRGVTLQPEIRRNLIKHVSARKRSLGFKVYSNVNHSFAKVMSVRQTAHAERRGRPRPMAPGCRRLWGGRWRVGRVGRGPQALLQPPIGRMAQRFVPSA